ncbi:MAG: DUF1566 domain-containing protein [Bacteroidetes bacterium]|nr:DUF1566 domain-containing protein [Bacteroidota bacterium]
MYGIICEALMIKFLYFLTNHTTMKTPWIIAAALLITVSCAKEKSTPIENPQVRMGYTQSGNWPYGFWTSAILDNQGSLPVKSVGFCVATHSMPDLSDKVYFSSIDTFTATIDSLSPHTQYYMRAFVSNSENTFFSEEITGATSSFYALNITATKIDVEIMDSISFQSRSWAAQSGVVGADSPTDGLANTSKIPGSSQNSAAKYCASLTVDGHSDWYLPSDKELYSIVQNSNQLRLASNATSLWSSTESDENQAISYSLKTFSPELRDKTEMSHFICIRHKD